MKIAPRWNEHSVPFCTGTCPAFGACGWQRGGDNACIPAVRVMARLLRREYWNAQEMRETVTTVYYAEDEP